MISRRLGASGLGALLWTTALVSPAMAQEYSPPAPPPIRETVDHNGVDLASGTLVARTHTISIGGSGAMGLSWSRTVLSSGSFRDSTAIILSVSGSTYTVSVGASSESFTLTGSNYVSDQKTGSTLTLSGTTYTYITRDGTIYTLVPWAGGARKQYSGNYRVSTIVYPTGEKLTFNWEYVSDICEYNIHAPDGCFQLTGERLGSVEATNGYKLQFDYPQSDPDIPAPAQTWAAILKVTALNMSVDPASQTWPSLSLGGFVFPTTNETVIDSLNRMTKYTFNSLNELSGIQRPGAASINQSIGYDANGFVNSVNNDGVSTSYTYADSGSLRTTTIHDAAAGDRQVVTDLTTGLVKSDTDEAGNTTSYTYYSGSGLVNTVTAPEGNKATFVYDGRGNLTSTTLTPKPGSPLSPVVTSTTYLPSDATRTWLCVSGTPTVTCNKPLTTTDALGNVTDYAWDPTTGEPTKKTSPAPTTGAMRPETRYIYSSYYAQYLNSSGSLVNFATPVTRLTGISQCQTTGSCSGTADEVKTTVAYGTANVLPISVSEGSGDGALTATSAFTWDAVGNELTVNGPLAGTEDTTVKRYDTDREVIGTVSPDPDGSGSRPNRAERLTYNADGEVTRTELGTIAYKTDADWANFVPLETVDTAYDANGRKTTETLSAGGTAYALTQTSYDSLGRVDCTAQRMNTAVFGSLPASACTLGTQGSDGPDRISKMAYDPVSRPQSITTGYGTSSARADATVTYTQNGKAATLKDAENNLTTIQYDGFDRATTMLMPLAAKGASTSNSSDSVQLTLDANGNVTAEKLRNGQTIGFSYDHLNRMTLKDLPGSEPDVSYTYDNLGRVLTASQTGNSLSFTWDALGRNLTQSGPRGLVTSAWDAAGRRTQITYPDAGLSVNYDYFNTGEISQIRENGATSGHGLLAKYVYDDLGNRRSVTFGSGATQTYLWDPISRLTKLTNNLAGMSDNLAIGPATTPITYNAASQITSAPRSNSEYSFAYSSSTHDFGTNGLNQLTSNTSSGTTKSFTYDANGNLTSDGVSTFGYSSQNQLTSATVAGVATSLAYDPAMRLYEVSNTSSDTRFGYDGVNAIGEYNAANALQRRYVFAPGDDQPIVWYEGASVDDTSRRFLSSDERGSIISVSDSSANKIGVNTYDEFGIPGAANTGRFQYTGQMWLPEVGLYHYKARAYSPTLSRFMQTDPIGFEGGVNIYSYVGDDPVNATDPSGLVMNLNCHTQIASVGDSPWSAIREVCTWTYTPDPPPRATGPGCSWVLRSCLDSLSPRGPRPASKPVPKTRIQCIKAIALTKDMASLVADGGAAVFTAMFPEARLGQLAFSGGSLVLAGASRDLKGIGNGIVNYHFVSFGAEASRVGGLAEKIVESGGKFTAAIAILNDVSNLAGDYNRCMSGE